MLKEKYISEAQMKEEPKKKLVLKIKEGSITPEHLSQRVVDEVITPMIEDSVEEYKEIAETIATSGMTPEDKAKLNALPTAEELETQYLKKDEETKSDWNATTGAGQILNKPSIISSGGTTTISDSSAVEVKTGEELSLGLYNPNKSAEVTINPMGVQITTPNNKDFTYNGNKVATTNQIPAYLSQLSNDKGFITMTPVNEAISDALADTVWNREQTLSEAQKQQVRENIDVGAADNEDIQNVSGELKFADKAYNTSSHSGLGRKYLRKNIVDNKNVLTQAMVNTANTIYHIQYDYDLNGQTITLPAGCVLEFEGGSIINGVLYGTNTRICTENNAIFNNIKITGNWLVPDIYSEWFADIHEENKINELISLCNNNIKNTVYIKETEAPYMVAVESDSGAGLVVDKANTDIVLSGNIKMVPNKFQHQYCVLISESNITINGGGKIIGDKDEHDYTTIAGTHEWGYGVNITGRKTVWSDAEIIYNISIRDIEVTNCAGDCIFFSWAQKINIDNVYLHNARRQGISCTNYAGEIRITNFKITNIYGTASGCGIDLELDNSKSYYGRNYVIENGYIADCYLGICVSKNNTYTESTSDNTIINNIIFSNDDEEYVDCFYNGCLLFANTRNVNVQNVVCTKENVQFFECRSAEDIIVSNAIGGHLKIILTSGSITFNNCSFSSNAKELIYDNSLIYGGSKQNLNIVFNNCNLLSTNYAFCYSTYPNNKRIQFNNCKVDAGTLVNMSQNAFYFYECNISCTNGMQTGEFHDCTIKVVTENQVPIRWVSSYNSTFDITLNCPSSSSYPGSVGKPFDFSANNIVFKDNVVTIKSDLTKPLNALFSIGTYQGHPFKDIKIINNKFIIAMDSPVQLATVYRAFIGPDSGIVVSNYGLYSNQGAKADRPNLKLVVNNRLSYPGVGTTGFKYYDTTLNKSIIWNGTNWVDESNNVVTYPITFNLTNLTSTNFVTPDKDSQYTFKLKAYTNYALPSSITVKMGASTLTNGTDYTYDSSTGDVVILGAGGSGGVTDALTITASGVVA